MSFTKTVSKGILTAALGFSLIGGGTYAYFSDTVVTNNTFAVGTLDLSVNPETIVDLPNLKPGDEIIREFELWNNGPLDISKILLETNYTVNDAQLGVANTEDLGEHIKVTILYNQANASVQVAETTLYELQNETPDLTAIDNFVGGGQRPDGLKETDKIIAYFEFVDNGEDQNEFQGDSLELEWKFNAHQTEGSEQ